MKRFIARWLLSLADLIDTLVEVLTFGLVLDTDEANVVYREVEAELMRIEWWLPFY